MRVARGERECERGGDVSGRPGALHDASTDAMHATCTMSSGFAKERRDRSLCGHPRAYT